MKYLSLLLLFVFALPLAAATLPFRGGEILAAELSTRKPKIAGEDPQAYLIDFDRPLYATLTVKMTRGRGLSTYDYSVELFGRLYPCIAIQVGDRGFDAANWEIKTVNPKEKYTLLFVINGRQVGQDKEELLTLRANYLEGAAARFRVPFAGRNGNDFTAPRSIPDAGKMPEQP